MEACRDLAEYAEYTYRVRRYTGELPIEEAVEQTINECIQEGILKDFLLQNRAEAKKISIYEYNEEEHMRMERRDAYEDGLLAGRERERAELFELMVKMTADGCGHLITQLANDPAFYVEMLRKYNK